MQCGTSTESKEPSEAQDEKPDEEEFHFHFLMRQTHEITSSLTREAPGFVVISRHLS
jgi:hypothetical protein